MKNFLWILLPLYLVGCSSYGVITAKYDSFQDATVVKMKLEHSAIDGDRTLDADYVNVIKNNTSEIKMKVTTSASAKEKEFQEKAFFSVDGKKFEVLIQNRKLTSQVRVEEHYQNNDGYVDYTKPTGSTSKTYNYLNGELKVSNNIADAIKKGKEILFRVYVDDNPITFKINESNKLKLVEFLNTKSAQKK